MRINFSLKVVLLSFFLSLFLFSCENENEKTTTEKQTSTFKEKLISSETIRTEDMITFRTKIHEAVQIGKNGDKQQYQKMLLEASKEYLDLNMIAYEKTGKNSEIFSKALNLYSERMKELNPTKK